MTTWKIFEDSIRRGRNRAIKAYHQRLLFTNRCTLYQS